MPNLDFLYKRCGGKEEEGGKGRLKQITSADLSKIA